MIKKIMIWITCFLFVLATIALTYFYQFAASWDELEKPIYSGSQDSIQVPFGLYVLVRGESGVGVFKLDYRVSRYGLLNGVKYSYWLSSDEDFSSERSKKYTGTVYEKYEVTKTISKNEVEVEDLGGDYNIIVGNYFIEWSADNHIYSRSYTNMNASEEHRKPFAIAATHWSDIKDIDFSDNKLIWLERN